MLGLSRLVADQVGSKIVAAMADVPNAAGSGANAAVTTSISFASDEVPQNRPGFPATIGGQLPGRYAVTVQPSQVCSVTVTNKLQTGFSVVLTPPSGGTIAAGTFDLIVIG
jgi:hypothetical protein